MRLELALGLAEVLSWGVLLPERRLLQGLSSCCVSRFEQMLVDVVAVVVLRHSLLEGRDLARHVDLWHHLLIVDDLARLESYPLIWVAPFRIVLEKWLSGLYGRLLWPP